MFNDDFKKRYTTIPFAIYKGCCTIGTKEVLPHQHRETELIYMTKGSGVFYLDSKEYPIEGGDVLLIPPYSLHRAQIFSNEASEYYCICFDLDLICDQWLKNGLESQTLESEHLIKNDADCAESARQCVENAFLACEQQEQGWEMIAVGNLSLLFGVLKGKGFFSEHTKSEKQLNFARDVFSYIVAHYADNITSRDLAGSLYLNHSFFCRSFKKTFGCCFTDYILAYRLKKAKEYLANSDLSVNDIAFKIGFNDCSYFCKAFRQRMGATPLAYRRSHAK